jgi:hypothetical protein
MSIFARSPYIVEISETGQEGSKIELRLWNGTGSAPTDPTYVLSKLIPASNNVKTYYNVSPYIREYISWDTRQTVYTTNVATPTAQWCNVEIKRYKLDSGVYTLLNTVTEKAYDGFGYYEQGYNPSLTNDILHDEGTFYYAYDATKNPSTNENYRSNFITVRNTATWKAKYTNLSTNANQGFNLSTGGAIQDIPKVWNTYYADGNKLEILTASNVVLWTGYFLPYLNCRYTPIVCDFVNKYGMWQRTWFFGASNDTLSVEKTDYNLMQGAFPNYSTLVGQRKSFNVNGKKTIKVNTDWVREDFKEIVKQLMLSERILLNSLPVKLNTQSTELFQNINTKMINYQMEFEFAYNAINNVI